MNDSYRILKKMKEKKQQRFAMATIIAVDGSTYRHPGAKMLIGEDDSQYGTISAGCLEEDLAYHAREIINHRQPKTVIYDLRSEDDLSWGQGAGCNGSIKVYVEPNEWEYIPPDHHQPIWPEVESVLNNGSKVASAKRVSDDDAQRVHLFYTDNGAVLGDAETGLKEKIIPELKRFLISGRKIELIRLADVEGEFLLELYEPREQLYIFGAGPDVEPIARLASHLDFFVTIIDPKTSRCNAEIFPTADQLIPEHPETYLQKNNIPQTSYVLIMTHSFQRDQSILRDLIASPPQYLGVLGPRLRTTRLMAPDALPDWVHSPIGLSIGAEGPEEISVSIMAELLKIKNKKIT
ncbi:MULTISPECIES: XdhC family protein [Paenibacillus]|nr:MULTISPECIES: XdhC/CoxI family protein [Paenibacillus]SDI92979.1 xanthine dehydrogenase accessory factor [Paenibacillus naphthalenovorans]